MSVYALLGIIGIALFLLYVAGFAAWMIYQVNHAAPEPREERRAK